MLRPFPFRLRSASLAALACLLAGPGCRGPSGSEPGSAHGYRILDFAQLGDSALALRIETWDMADPPDAAPRPREAFALLDRKRGTLARLDTLPHTAAPTFPSWFYTCEAGRPVSVHPKGFSGPAGSCVDSHPPAISPEGYALAFADSQARVNLLSWELEPITFRITGADSAAPLEYASSIGRVHILEWHGGGDSILWRGFANDDPSGSDSARLKALRRVRVHGEGTKLVCSAPEENESLPFCWAPPGINAFRYALDQAAGSPLLPEWDPGTGKLAWLEGAGAFVFLDPAADERIRFEAGPLLSAYRPGSAP
jgi:hypothetical protein